MEAEPDRAMQTFCSQLSELRDDFIKPLTIVHVMVAHASVASSKSKVELELHTDTCLVGNNCLVLHDNNNNYSYDSSNVYRNVQTVDAAVGYQDQQSGKKVYLKNKASYLH